jgi:hypothetical protein
MLFRIIYAFDGRFFVFLLIFKVFIISSVQAQTHPPIPLPLEHGLNRQQELKELEAGLNTHRSVRPRIQLPDTSKATGTGKSWLLRKAFHEHLIELKQPDWGLQFDLLGDFAIGRDYGNAKNTWLSTQGFLAQGYLGSKVSFTTSFYISDAIFPAYIDSFIRNYDVVPGQGRARPKGTRGVLGYASANGFFTYQPSQFLNFQFGQGQQFIGEGYRSMLMADVAFPNPFLRMQAKFGPFEYTYWFQQMVDIYSKVASPDIRDGLFRKKYASMSYLDWKVTERLSLGAFQSIVWLGDDSLGNSKTIPWQYLNPVLLYWPIQYSTGSEGNFLLAVTASYKTTKYSQAYMQFLIDEMVTSEFFANNGAVVNKYSLQLGWKDYKAFGVKNLFFLSEFNMVRPYTYSHWSTLTNYGHSGQPIAHPAGANFTELLGMTEYNWNKSWFASAKAIAMRVGKDSAGLNFGQDIRQDYYTAPGGIFQTGASIGWGRPANSLHLEAAVGRVLNPKTNLRIELRYIYRHEDMDISTRNTHWFMLGLRSQLRNLYYDY